jgi:hypothetical protein
MFQTSFCKRGMDCPTPIETLEQSANEHLSCFHNFKFLLYEPASGVVIQHPWRPVDRFMPVTTFRT